jgi:predicted kinase
MHNGKSQFIHNQEKDCPSASLYSLDDRIGHYFGKGKDGLYGC